LELNLDDVSSSRLIGYLSGKSPALVEAFTEACANARLATPFEHNLLLQDLVQAESLFQRATQRVWQMTRLLGVTRGWIAPELLFDHKALKLCSGVVSGPATEIKAHPHSEVA
jgi:hypothetical protein